MANWTANPIMEWSTDNGTTWTKISDHGRSPLSISSERLGTSHRMASGTMRRYTITKKKTFTTSWENLPDKNVSFLANGQCGDWMETFYNNTDGPFYIRLREGSDKDTTFTGMNGTVFQVMITEFSKEVTKRGRTFDLWNLDITLEEV